MRSLCSYIVESVRKRMFALPVMHCTYSVWNGHNAKYLMFAVFQVDSLCQRLLLFSFSGKRFSAAYIPEDSAACSKYNGGDAVVSRLPSHVVTLNWL